MQYFSAGYERYMSSWQEEEPKFQSRALSCSSNCAYFFTYEMSVPTDDGCNTAAVPHQVSEMK
jgi:hypothetical protein